MKIADNAEMDSQWTYSSTTFSQWNNSATWYYFCLLYSHLLLGLLSPPIRTSFDGLVADAAAAAAAILLAASEAVEAAVEAKTPEEAPIGNDFVTSEPTTFCFFSAIVLLCLEVIFEAEAATEAELLLGSSVWHSSSSSSVT